MMTDDDKMENGASPENPNETNEMGEPGGVDQELAAARAEAAQLKDQLLRAMAETENTRRRAQRDREDAQKYGISSFAREMLSVADNLHRALEAIPQEALAKDEALKTLYDGVAATERQLEAAFEKQAIKRIWPEGERFDSNQHQAMFEVPGSDKPAGTVVQVLQAGYMIHDRLLRPALVGVAKGGAANDGGPQAGSVDTVA
jgi:molecular chaperone GrpE